MVGRRRWSCSAGPGLGHGARDRQRRGLRAVRAELPLRAAPRGGTGAAGRVAEALGVARHVVADIDLRVFGGSALTADIDVPHHDRVDDLDSTEIPVTYVPARNTVFLSFALAWAETLGSSDIFIGVNALDYSGYPDCRPEYIAAYEQMANLATKAGVEGSQQLKIHTPLIELTKAQTIERGLRTGRGLRADAQLLRPGRPDGRACGNCDSCLLRAEGLRRAGLTDPRATR